MIRVSSVKHDYARKHSSLAGLPTLKSLLEASSEDSAPIVVMDNVQRLFITCELGKRGDLFFELEPYSSNIMSLVHGQTMEQMNPTIKRALALSVKPQRFKTKSSQDRSRDTPTARRQTLKARRVSAVARKERADQLAKALSEIQSELSTEGKTPTLSQVAREANRRGLLTERETPWSSSKVGRQLRRLSKPENEGSD